MTVADADFIKAVLLCVGFIGLNILDAWLTRVALGFGSNEFNPFINISLGSSMLVKGLISFLIVVILVSVERGGLLKPLSMGMLLICVWNGLAVLSWS